MDNIKTTGAVQGTAKNPADVYGKPNGPTATLPTPSNIPIPNPAVQTPAPAKRAVPPTRERKQPVPPGPVTSGFRSKIAKGKPDAKTVLDIAEATIENGSMERHLARKTKEADETLAEIAANPAESQMVHPRAFGKVVDYKPEMVKIGNAYLEVKRKIHYADLIDAIQWCVNVVVDDRTFISAPLAEIVEDIAILKFFSNLDTSDVDQAYFSPTEFYVWYDIMSEVNAFEIVRGMIDEKQVAFLHRTIGATLTSIVAYRNSAAGLIDTLSAKNSDDRLQLDSALSALEGAEGHDLQSLLKMYEKFGK